MKTDFQSALERRKMIRVVASIRRRQLLLVNNKRVAQVFSHQSFTSLNCSFRFHSTTLLAGENSIFLHVAPNDVWIAPSIFAAKHLEPDYIKSVPIPTHICPDTLLEMIEENVELQRQVYDKGELPEQVLLVAAQSNNGKDDNKGNK